LEKKLKSLLEKEDESTVEKVAADILRSLLLLYGSAWESDLKDMLMLIWSNRQLSLDEIGELQAALAEAEKLLERIGLIKIEEKYRGDLGRSEPISEKLYTTAHILLLMKVFGGDRELDKVRFQLQG